MMVAESRRSIATNVIFTYRFGAIVHRNLSLFATPATSFYIRNQDPLLTDIPLLQDTLQTLASVGGAKRAFALPPEIGTKRTKNF